MQPYRPVRYSIIGLHTLRTRLDEVDVDLSSVEESIECTVKALSAKVAELEAKLAQFEEGIEDEPKDDDEVVTAPKGQPKPKAKTRTRKRAAKGKK